MGEPLLLPQAVLGLAEWDGQLVALSSDGLRLLGSMAMSFGVMMLPQRWQNPLELVQVQLEAVGKSFFWVKSWRFGCGAGKPAACQSSSEAFRSCLVLFSATHYPASCATLCQISNPSAQANPNFADLDDPQFDLNTTLLPRVDFQDAITTNVTDYNFHYLQDFQTRTDPFPLMFKTP